jgi:ankyrin repeat protein
MSEEILGALKKGPLAYLEQILRRNSPQINVPDASGLTPLHHAAQMGNCEYIRLLVVRENVSEARNFLSLHSN